jgi:Zn-dependent peptidase ImmA (M78 family)
MAKRLSVRDFLSKHEFKIAGLTYKIAWCKVIDDKSTLGYCCDESKVIYLKEGEDEDETFKTMIHELVHAIDHVYSLKLRHAQVRKLELALADFMLQNDLVK